MKAKKTAALSLGAFMLLSNGMPVFAESNTSIMNVTGTYSKTIEATIDNVSNIIQDNIDAIEIETPQPQEEISYTYVEQPVYYTVTETVNEPVVMSFDGFYASYGQKEVVEVPVDTSNEQAAYDAALTNYNVALAEYEVASQIIETTREVEVEVAEETVDDEGNPITETKTEIQTVTETSYAGDVETAQANLDAAKAALDVATAQLTAASNTVEQVVVEEETVNEQAQNAWIMYSGECGDNLTWTLDDSGLLTISGTGNMYDYTNEEVPWPVRYVIKVAIEEGVTNVGECAFKETEIAQVTLPNTLTRIEEYSFSNSRSLSSIVIPDSVTYVGRHAFESCYSLRDVTISKNLTSIEESTFESCWGLTSIVVPDSVKNIKEYAFASCFKLTDVNLGTGVETIGASAFKSCYELQTIKIPNNVTALNQETFADCAMLKEVVLPENLEFIDNMTFYGCTSLEKLIIPESVNEISPDAFVRCDNLTLHVFNNSYALDFAIDNEIPYVIISAAVLDSRHTLSLDGNIGVNFYLVFTPYVFEDEAARVEFKVGDYTVSKLINDAERDSSGYRKFTVEVTSAQMTEDILAKVYVNDTKIYSETYTVKEYCDSRLADITLDNKLRNLLEALLNYGGYAQKQFNVNINNLANKDLANTDVSDVTADLLAPFEVVKTGSEEGISHEGSTLTLDSLTSIKHYFKVEDGYDVGSFVFISDEGVLIPIQSGNLYYVKISNIASFDLDTVHTVNVGGFTIDYSALSYAYAQLNKATAKESLKNVCRAMYKYNVAANQYFNK